MIGGCVSVLKCSLDFFTCPFLPRASAQRYVGLTELEGVRQKESNLRQRHSLRFVDSERPSELQRNLRPVD